MAERIPNWKIFVDALLEMFSKTSVKVYEHKDSPMIGTQTIDVQYQNLKKYAEANNYPIQTSSSIWFDEHGDPSGEIMIPHCKTYNKQTEYYLVTEGIDICTPGCNLKQVHTHSGKIPASHFHIECRFNEKMNTPHCIRKLATLIKKGEEFADKTCTD